MSQLMDTTACKVSTALHSPVFGRLIAVALCEAVGVAGAMNSDTGNSRWYRSLRKPAFQPPPSVFAPVWTALYALMGLSLYELWQRRHHPGGPAALRAFGTQLALNGIWTPVFFGLHSLAGGLGVILGLWGSLLSTLNRTHKVSQRASAMLIPYFAWVSFATVLNAAVVALNPRRDSILRRFM